MVTSLQAYCNERDRYSRLSVNASNEQSAYKAVCHNCHVSFGTVLPAMTRKPASQNRSDSSK